MHLIAGRQCQAYVFHFRHHFIAQLQLVGSFHRRDRHINGIQTIDTIVALRFFFHVSYLYEFIQVDDLSVGSRHCDIRRIELPTDSIRHQHQAYPLFTFGRIHVVCTQKFLVIV